MTEYLVGTHTKLVKFTDRHVTANYIGWLNDQHVNRYMCAGRKPLSSEDIVVPSGDKEMRFSIMSNLHYDANKDVLVKTDTYDDYIGTMSFTGVDWICRRAEIGYMIGSRSHWGNGVATEIIGLISDYGFNRLGFRKIEAGVVDGNIGSVKALEKNGFKKYGVVPEEYYLEGRFLDVDRFYKIDSWNRY